jgi:hypothetical protein
MQCKFLRKRMEASHLADPVIQFNLLSGKEEASRGAFF